MKKQHYKKTILLGLLLFGLNPFLVAATEKGFDSVEVVRMEQWKQSPHSMLLSFGTLMYHKEAYRIFKQMPVLNFSLTYNYDIPWRHKRSNFFVLAGFAYEGCRRNDKPYQAKNKMVYENYIFDNFHISTGAGLKVRLTYFLDLSFSVALDGAYSYEFGRYPSLYGSPFPTDRDRCNYFRRDPHVEFELQNSFSLSLAYEIKYIRIFVGCQFYVRYDVGYYRDRLNWRTDTAPIDSWVIFGVGYRF
ncbi:hypothetical protein HDR62_03120 [bacterium]|nr:hypothetical protein [bacterium]